MRAFSAAYSTWADAAEKEIIEATGAHYYGAAKKQGLRGKPPVMVWRSIVPERPPDTGGQGQVLWRSVAAKAIEVQRALRHMLAARPELARRDVRDADAEDEGGDDGNIDDDLHDPISQLAQAYRILDDVAGELNALGQDPIDDDLTDAINLLKGIIDDA